LPYSFGWLFHTVSKPMIAVESALTTGLASALLFGGDVGEEGRGGMLS
jgi:hypothetical protein